MKLTDTFVKSIFKSHPYSSCHTKILEDIDKISKEEDLPALRQMLFTALTHPERYNLFDRFESEIDKF
jgi:hypothetical protein